MADSSSDPSDVSTYTLFQQPWWLDATAKGEWTSVEVMRNGVVAGRLPFRTRRRYGLTMMTMPPLTPAIGPWIRSIEGKESLRIADEIALLEELIAQLPKADLFRHGFAPEITNLLPLMWNDFELTPAYTYRINDLGDPDRIWTDMRDKHRHAVRKAQRSLVVHSETSLEDFFSLQEKTFARQHLPVPFTLDYLRQIDTACTARNCRRIFTAADADGRPHASVYIIWDHRSAYYLLGGSDPELRSSGAQSLALWEAIRFASSVTRCFDFEGSILRPIEHFFRGFGGHLTPYVIATRMSERMRLLYGVRRAARIARAVVHRRAPHDKRADDA
jgi:hypothetical protein